MSKSLRLIFYNISLFSSRYAAPIAPASLPSTAGRMRRASESGRAARKSLSQYCRISISPPPITIHSGSKTHFTVSTTAHRSDIKISTASRHFCRRLRLFENSVAVEAAAVKLVCRSHKPGCRNILFGAADLAAVAFAPADVQGNVTYPRRMEVGSREQLSVY